MARMSLKAGVFMRLLPIALIALSLTACSGGEPIAPEPAAEAPAGPAFTREGETFTVPEGSSLRERLVIETLEARPVRRSLEAPAHVEADPSRLARITPPLAGRVVQLFVRFGEEVEAGQPLLSLDSPELVSAQTEALNARSALAQAERILARQRDLATHGISSRADLEQAETSEQIARQEVQRAHARLRLLGISPGNIGRALTLRSPISGRVVEMHVAVGEFHSELATPLMTIADLSQVWVTADVQERDLARVSVGMNVSAELAAYPQEPIEGTVLHVGDLLDPTTRTLPLRIQFENSDARLHPGMFARVTFEETARPEIVIPAPAIVLHGDANTVYVEVRPWVFERRPVTLGEPVGNATIVTGLEAGTRIVVANAVLLQ